MRDQQEVKTEANKATLTLQAPPPIATPPPPSSTVLNLQRKLHSHKPEYINTYPQEPKWTTFPRGFVPLRREVRGQPFLSGATKKRGCRGWRLEAPAHLSREKTGVTWQRQTHNRLNTWNRENGCCCCCSGWDFKTSPELQQLHRTFHWLDGGQKPGRLSGSGPQLVQTTVNKHYPTLLEVLWLYSNSWRRISEEIQQRSWDTKISRRSSWDQNGTGVVPLGTSELSCVRNVQLQQWSSSSSFIKKI